jgi:hypothetical protein
MNSSFRGSLLAAVAGCMLGAAVLSPPAQGRHHEHDQRIQRYYGRTSAPIFSTIRAVDARQGRSYYRHGYRYNRWSSAPSFTTIRTFDTGWRPYYRRRYRSVWRPVTPLFPTMRVAGSRQYYGYVRPRRWRHRHHRHRWH